MASFAHALRSFRSGSLSQEQLYAEVDRILQDGRRDEGWLLETLDEENTKVPLPPSVHDAVKQRIERAAQDKAASAGEAQTGAGYADPDVSRTQLATRFFSEMPEAPPGAHVEPQPAALSGNALTGAGTVPGNDYVKGVGDVLNGRFVLEERVGAGGMSTVYKALDRRKLEADDRNPYVAVKVLNVEFRSHPQSLIALQREAKKSQSLAHPNIVRVYDFDRDGATVYMTMEYLSGKSLAQILRAPDFKGMPREQSIAILERIADALKFAHDNGIVHADFKPANVIITDAGQVKVIDFGIARAFQRPDQTDMEVTRFDPGSLGALTPTYASPEMLEHQEVDPRDDVYALGCITYEMLTGRHPFGRMQATEARDGGLQLERRKGLTRRQWKALRSALAFDREKRTPSVRQFCNDVSCDGVMSSTGARVTAVAASLLVVAGVAAYLYNSHQTPTREAAASDPPSGATLELAGLELETQQAARSEVEEVADTAPGPEPVPVQTPRERTREAPVRLATATVPPSQSKAVPADEDLRQLSLAAVTPVIEPARCAALDASVKDGTVNLSGYVTDRFDMNSIERDLLALPGARRVNADLRRVSDAVCDVLELYAPYWRHNQRADGATAIRTVNSDGKFKEGEPLVVNITTPPYDSFVSLDYYSLDGGVVHMVPGPRIRANQAPPNYAATIGDLGEWRIAEPFGDEMVVVLTTPRPLFETLRAEAEPGGDYLEVLEKRLQALTREVGKDEIKADFVVISTRPKALLERLKESALGK
jgi:predicted Ser/Thr protein kinase